MAGHALIGFDDETEVLRRLGDPLLVILHGLNRIKGTVQLDDLKGLAVSGQPFDGFLFAVKFVMVAEIGESDGDDRNPSS